MAAATAVIFDPEEIDALKAQLKRLQAENLALRDRVKMLVPLHERIEALEGERDVLLRQMLLERLRHGDVPAPEQIETRAAAEAWLAWARTNQHTEGCSCHRCIRARPLVGR
ncbi:hypothetical protein ACFL6C_06125 [Myxococcota bacterium]